MYKQTNTIFKTKRIWLFVLIINCTISIKTNSWFSRNVYAISNRIWCNRHLRHTGKCDNPERQIPLYNTHSFARWHQCVYALFATPTSGHYAEPKIFRVLPGFRFVICMTFFQLNSINVWNRLSDYKCSLSRKARLRCLKVAMVVISNRGRVTLCL